MPGRLAGHAGEWRAAWVRSGLQELPLEQTVFATDYPQAVRETDEVVAYVDALRDLSADARALVEGANAEKLIPDIRERTARAHKCGAKGARKK